VGNYSDFISHLMSRSALRTLQFKKPFGCVSRPKEDSGVPATFAFRAMGAEVKNRHGDFWERGGLWCVGFGNFADCLRFQGRSLAGNGEMRPQAVDGMG
jgi:hypothetical protein